MEDMRELVYLGPLAVFYVPIKKLDSIKFNNKTPRELFEEFLMEHFNAFTLTITNTQGFWRKHKQSPIFCDQNAQYNVSFDGNVEPFVKFLSEMCHIIQEQSIYLTIENKSWLVLPKENK